MTPSKWPSNSAMKETEAAVSLFGWKFFAVLSFVLLPLLLLVNHEGVQSLGAILTGESEEAVVLLKSGTPYAWQTQEVSSRSRRHTETVTRTGVGYSINVGPKGGFLGETIWLPAGVWGAIQQGQAIKLLRRKSFPEGLVVEGVGWRSAGIFQLIITFTAVACLYFFFWMLGKRHPVRPKTTLH